MKMIVKLWAGTTGRRCYCSQIVRKEDNGWERLEEKIKISALAMMSLW